MSLLGKVGHIAMVPFATMPLLILATNAPNKMFGPQQIYEMAIDSTKIACIGVVLDKLFNQNYIPSKPLQYLAIIAEGIICANIYSNYMVSYGGWNDLSCGVFGLEVLTATVQALALKYIWDSEEDTTDDIAIPELNLVEMDNL